MSTAAKEKSFAYVSKTVTNSYVLIMLKATVREDSRLFAGVG